MGKQGPVGEGRGGDTERSSHVDISIERITARTKVSEDYLEIKLTKTLLKYHRTRYSIYLYENKRESISNVEKYSKQE